MKFYHIIILYCLIFSCTHIKPYSTLFKDINEKIDIEESLTSPLYYTEKIPRLQENVIDDFEAGVGLWILKATKDCTGSISSINSTKGKTLRLQYQFPVRRFRRIEPDEIMIVISRDIPFEKYSGIQFLARSEQSVPLRMILFEKNSFKDGIIAKELWYTEVKLTSQWKRYKFKFTELLPEEYYEQGYIGNDRIDPIFIKEVGFSIRNINNNIKEDTGSIELDDIILF